MAEKTINNFQIPSYTEKADIPGMVRDNIENAEAILANIKGNLDALHDNMSGFDVVLTSMQSLLGTLSDELDEVNGVTAEEPNEVDSEAEE
ncbi:hypothetical protein FMM68_12545 [Lachnospiraceae bacterium MD329]|nr:hypothetical protein [Lachnospiraceae bacterium MD329]